MKVRDTTLYVLILTIGMFGLGYAQPTPTRTQVKVFTPFNSGGLMVGVGVVGKVKGQCMGNSAATSGRPDAWRCSAGNAIMDPCFENILGNEKELACAEDPFSADVTLLTLASNLPDAVETNGPDFKRDLPWALELENGQKCTLFTGATAPVAGMRINYGCKDSAQVVGPVDRTRSLWRVFYQTANRSLSLDQVGISTAWY